MHVRDVARNNKNISDHFGRSLSEVPITDKPVRRALLADDNHALCKYLIMALKIIGFEVRTARNGQEAYELFLENSYDLVITDFKMPVMNGITLIRKLKSKSPNIPIILISGVPIDDLSKIGCHAPIEGILHKPFSLNELHRTALRAISRPQHA